MNARLYNVLIFFLGLLFAASLFQAIIRFQLGAQLFFFDSYLWWFLIVNIINLTVVILTLKYFQSQRYRFAFVAGTIFALANICHVIIIFTMLEYQKLAGYNIPTQLLSSIIGLIYSISLILLAQKRKYWLAMIGILMFTLSLLYVIIIIRIMYFTTSALVATIENIAHLTDFASCIVPVLFILHFLSERKKSNKLDTEKSAQQQFIGLLAFTFCFIFSLLFGGKLLSDCRTQIYWTQVNFNRTKALAKLCEFRIFKNSNGNTLMYQLLKPLNYDSTIKYPLVVSLPYGGQPATDTLKQIEGAVAAELLSTGYNREKYPAFIFIPHCPPGGGWGGIPNYPSIDSLVYQAISSLDDKFSIDTKRRYVTGLSRGGYGTWNFICRRPDLFAAAIPVSGAGNPALAHNAVEVAVWSFHGKKDKNVPVEGDREMIQALEKAGAHPKYTE